MDLHKLYKRWESEKEKLSAQKASFVDYLKAFNTIYCHSPVKPVYWPSQQQISDSNIGKFISEKGLADYNTFHSWSTLNKSQYWEQVLSKLKIKFERDPTLVLGNDSDYETPNWCENGVLNIVNSIFNKNPEHIAIIQGVENSPDTISITYRELDRLSAQIANGLIDRGYKKGERCAIFMPLNIESVAIYLGIVKAGLTVVSIADSFSGAELKSRMELVGTQVLFTIDHYEYGGKCIQTLTKTRDIEQLKIVVRRSEKTLLSNNEIDYQDFLGSVDFEPMKLEPNAISNILFSSGTTKAPKAIPWTHLTPIKCAADAYFHQDVSNEDIITWTTGMGWMMAPWLIYAGLINGATIALWEGSMSTSNYAEFIEDTQITILGTIPSLVKSWRKSKVLENRNLKIRLFSSTGEPSNEEDYFYLMSLVNFKSPIIEYCGGTEIGGGYITGTPVQPSAPATFTTPALGLDFVLVDDNNVVAPKGEVFLIPPSIGLSEKLLNRDHHEEYFSHLIQLDGKTLRKHGDAYEKHITSDYQFVFFKCMGRVDDSMNLGGVKIASIEIEEVVNTHPNITQSIAVGYSKLGGPEELYIFITTPVSDNLLLELNKMISNQINPLFRISEIISVDLLPRTASNKLIRRALKDQLKAERH